MVRMQVSHGICFLPILRWTSWRMAYMYCRGHVVPYCRATRYKATPVPAVTAVRVGESRARSNNKRSARHAARRIDRSAGVLERAPTDASRNIFLKKSTFGYLPHYLCYIWLGDSEFVP
eukprot:SAG31_NODE_4225_length_3445_cov_1.903467_2_plen_119_part_00